MQEAIKVVLFGPESTGKTSLSKKLAEKYHTLWCPEFARDYLSLKNDIENRFVKGIISTYEDIEHIAIGQMSLEDSFATQANGLLFCDTNLLTNLIYSNYYFNKHPLWLGQTLQKRHYDLYLLLGTDLAWEYDPLRDRPDAREYLYALFKQTLQEQSQNFVEIKGQGKERLENAIQAIDFFLNPPI